MMASDFARAFGLAHKLFTAGSTVGMTQADWNKLAEDPALLRQIGFVLHDYAEIKRIEHVIDCDAPPFVPDGWKVEEHQKCGQLKWDPTKVELLRSQSQKEGKHTEVNELCDVLTGRPFLNANVLDYLLLNQHLIPEKWKELAGSKTSYVFFWGTLYLNKIDTHCIRCLYWKDDRWNSSAHSPMFGFRENDYAALRKI